MYFQEQEYFLAIAKHKNLTKAAQELYVSQPTITKFLQKLEKNLGGKLFRKDGHTYNLTFLGQRYLAYAQKVVTLNQDWEKELLDMRSSFKGELNISFPPMRSMCIIPQILPEFHKLHPAVHINFYEQGHNIQDSVLSDGKLDFAIFSEWQPHPNLSYEHLIDEEIVLILPKNHELTEKAVYRDGFRYPWIDLKLLADTPFILHFPDQNTGRSSEQLFEQYNIQPPVPFRTRNSQLCIQLTAENLGVCLAPETYALHSSSMLPISICSVGEKPIVNRLVLAYRKNSYLFTYALDFIKIAKTCLKR